MNRRVIILLGIMVLLSACTSPDVQHVKQTYYYPPEGTYDIGLDSLVREFKDLNVDRLDDFFDRWEELSSRVVGSRPLCELDSLVRYVWDHYSYLELRKNDTSRYITFHESIDVYYFDRALREDTYVGPVWRRGESWLWELKSPAKDTLTLDYFPILAGVQKPVLYFNGDVYKLLRSFVDGSEENEDIIRKYIPLDSLMSPRDFVNSVPVIYEIHFYENGIMVDSQIMGTYEEELFFPADGSPSIEVGGAIQ